MTVNTEFFLTRHPLLFLFRESCIKSLCCVCVFATVGGCARNIHQLSAVECIWYKFTDEKCRREIAVNNKTDIFLFATDKSSADVITGISEISSYCLIPSDLGQALACISCGMSIAFKKMSKKQSTAANEEASL